jgi:hypothetical protein
VAHIPRFSLTVIATTGEQFTDFAPYAASLNDAGTVAFQAALRDGGSGVFAGNGGEVVEIVGPMLLAGVTSHPDVNRAAAVCFYGVTLDAAQAVFLFRDGRLQTVGDTGGRFALVGPLGPTMNEAGVVAFRAERAAGVSGIFAADSGAVVTVADTGNGWSRFHGLPLVDGAGSVVFRADREDGIAGVYEARDADIETVAEAGEVFETIGAFPSVNDDGIAAFAAALRGGGAAIATVRDGHVTIVDTEGAFEAFRGALIAGDGAVVRIATPRGGTLGLFAGPNPDADRILAIGDDLLGSTVADFAANPVSINAAGQVAICASLTDGKQYILRTDPVG